MILKFLMSLILTDSRLQRETLLFLCSQQRVFFQLQSTPDNSNLQGKSKKVRVSGSSSYREYEANNRKGGNGVVNECK